MWLSLGPRPHSYRPSARGLGLYGVLYEHVPGFDGLRVPARYAMIAALFVSIAAGYGVAVVEQVFPRRSRVAMVLAAVFLAEAFFAPMTINATSSDVGVAPPARVEPASEAPAVYRQLAAMADVRRSPNSPSVIRRGKCDTSITPRCTGSGWSTATAAASRAATPFLPRSCTRLAADPEAAWRALRDAGTSHVIVHRSGFANGQAATVEDWLMAHGARLSQTFGDDALYVLPAGAGQ